MSNHDCAGWAWLAPARTIAGRMLLKRWVESGALVLSGQTHATFVKWMLSKTRSRDRLVARHGENPHVGVRVGFRHWRHRGSRGQMTLIAAVDFKIPRVSKRS